jgi:hypothetical protein
MNLCDGSGLFRLFLAILRFDIDSPDIILGRNSTDNIFDGGHRGQPRVILFGVLVHTVAAYREKILKAICKSADRIEAVMTRSIQLLSARRISFICIFQRRIRPPSGTGEPPSMP